MEDFELDYYCEDYMYDDYEPLIPPYNGPKFVAGDLVMVDGKRGVVINSYATSYDMLVGFTERIGPDSFSVRVFCADDMVLDDMLKGKMNKHNCVVGIIVSKKDCMPCNSCTCGSAAVYGEKATHSDWCDLG